MVLFGSQWNNYNRNHSQLIGVGTMESANTNDQHPPVTADQRSCAMRQSTMGYQFDKSTFITTFCHPRTQNNPKFGDTRVESIQLEDACGEYITTRPPLQIHDILQGESPASMRVRGVLGVCGRHQRIFTEQLHVRIFELLQNRSTMWFRHITKSRFPFQESEKN